MPPRDPAGGSGGAIGRLKPCFAESSGVYKSQRNHDGFQAEISHHGHCVLKGQREFVNAGRRGLAGRNPLHTLCVWPGVARIARSTRAERQSCSIVKPADDIAAHSVQAAESEWAHTRGRLQKHGLGAKSDQFSAVSALRMVFIVYSASFLIGLCI